MIGALTLNGQEAEATFGLIVTGYGGDLGAPTRTLNLLEIPALPGGVDPGVTLAEAPRVLTVNFMVNVATDALLYAALRAIKEVCGTGLVEIQTLYSTTRALYGVLQPFEAGAFEKTIPGWASGSMQFLCPLPYWVATTHDTIGFGATATDIPLGSAPSRGRDQWSAMIEIVGQATTPTLTYLTAAGDTVSTMIFSGYSPAAGDSIVIDVGRRLVSRFVSGTRSNALSYLTAGYTFPTLDPSDGNVTAGAYPKLKVSTGSASIRYYRMDR